MVSLALAVQLYGSALGVANDYNIFVFNNLTVTGSDSGGRIAVGGTASFDQAWYSVGDAVLHSFSAPDNETLDVADTISTGPAQIYAGHAYLASGSPSDVSLVDGGTLTEGGTNPVNVAGQYSFLNSYATQLSQLSANSTVNNSLWFDVSATATVLINVIGTSITTSDCGFFWNGAQITGNSATEYQNVLFNFYQATSIDLTGTFQGTVLAPNAAVTGGDGQLDGGLPRLFFCAAAFY